MRLHHIPYQEVARLGVCGLLQLCKDRKSTRLNSSHSQISYAVFCLKKKKQSRTRKLTTPGLSPSWPPTGPTSAADLAAAAGASPARRSRYEPHILSHLARGSVDSIA